jgi:Icc-related predicted phosphoesterase
MEKIKLTFISDTHGLHYKMTEDLTGGDMIIHAGDVSNRGLKSEIEDFLFWFSNLPYKHKIFIAGNHDFEFERIRSSREEGIRIPDGVTYLQDESVTIDGIKIYGSPWQPWFHDWAFNLYRGEALAEKWNQIPDDVDILVTHGPPHGILDRTERGMIVGCEDLYKRVFEIKPKIHLFGHIHEGYGMREIDDVIFINASTLDADYLYNNKPIDFEFNK